MKKSGILHAELSRQIGLLGHTDRFVVCDSGLPLPRTMPVIDLALTGGTLDFRTVLDAILDEVVVQAHFYSQDASTTHAGEWLSERADALGEGIPKEHTDFKAMVPQCVFAVRTGEQTGYANVICEAGVSFDV